MSRIYFWKSINNSVAYGFQIFLKFVENIIFEKIFEKL